MTGREDERAWRLQLLGSPQLVGEGRALKLDRKMAAVLAHVVLAGPSPRALLRDWLWPDASPERARNSLRQTLHRLRTLAPLELLRGAEQLSLAPQVPVDVLQVGRKEPLGAGPAEGLGELLGGFDYRECPAFDAWLQLQRQRLGGIRQRAET